MIRIIVLAVIWLLSGTLVTWSLGYSLLRSLQVDLVGLISALGYVALVILPIEYNRRLFFDGPGPEDEFYVHIGCLWYIPLTGLTWLPIILLVRFLFLA